MLAFRALALFAASLIDDTEDDMSARDYVITNGTALSLKEARKKIGDLSQADATWIQRCMDRLANGECLSFSCYGADVLMARNGMSIYYL